MERMHPLLAPWTRDIPVEALEVVRIAEYTFRARLADRWRDRRVFLLGDAAHLTPPFIGQGLCAGLRDAANLAWKLAGVLDDSLPSSVLDSYQAERKPHARAMIRLAKLIGTAMTQGSELGNLLRRIVVPRLCLLPGLSRRVLDSETPALRRSGLVVRPRVRRTLGGHSVGSAIAIIEAGTYHDVDGVLITGLPHGINPLGALPILASLIPANLDPKLSTRGYDVGYLTTAPGVRFADFHQPGIRVPGVPETDEDTKDAFAPGEVVDTVLLGAILPYSKKIKVPVMLMMGNDPAFCGFLRAPDCSTAQSLYRAESSKYAPEAKLHTFVVRSYGHTLNLAPDAPTYLSAVVSWANKMVGK